MQIIPQQIFYIKNIFLICSRLLLTIDYKKAGFGSWWALLLFGIAVVVLGCFGLRNIDVAGKALSWMIGIGVIVVGLAYLLAVVGVNRFEKLEKEATAN
jgi:uncharacterized membrane protein HdeD (DUF308 family)